MNLLPNSQNLFTRLVNQSRHVDLFFTDSFQNIFYIQFILLKIKKRLSNKSFIGGYIMGKYKIGCDIGGTFTDIILYENENETVKVYKLLSSPENFEQSVVAGIKNIIKENNVPFNEVDIVCHSTTVALNTLVERKGDKTALITTKGFRDVLEIGRATRDDEYDLFQDKVSPLVPRHLRFEVKERLNYKGEVIAELDDISVIDVAQNLKQQGVRSIAVSFLHSYANSEHEKKAKELILSVIPNAIVSLSSEINPVYREYERTSSTVINAYVAPKCIEYLTLLESKISAIGLKCQIHITQSSGGLMTLDSSKKKPIHILMAGPAAGVYAASKIADLSGYKNVISLDTGGTTQLVSLVIDGKITPIIDGNVAGYPIRTPIVDVKAIGAGGGSIARVDSGGKLNVGPISAGADPGPVCYGNGGKEPTVTDADVVLGYLNPEFFLGGDIKLDKDKASKSIREKIAVPLNMSDLDAAAGIIEVVNSERMGSIRKLLIQAGHDPRDFVMVAFGGAGPVHAAELAKELGLKAVIVPNHPGLLSPLGSLSGEQRRDFIQTINADLDELDLENFKRILFDMKEKLSNEFMSEGIARNKIVFKTQADVKYEGQLEELIIDIPDHDKWDAETIKKLFFSEHDRLFGYYEEDENVVLTNLRLIASHQSSTIKFKGQKIGNMDSSHALKGTRKVFFKEYSDLIDCRIYDRSKLKSNNLVKGPAIIEEYDSTIVIYPDQKATVDTFSNLIISEELPKEKNSNSDKQKKEVTFR